MEENEKSEILPLDKCEETFLVRINPQYSNLVLDTQSEWSKGFLFVNKLIIELAKTKHVVKKEDDLGKEYYEIKLHPQLLSWMQERRKLFDQYWKISGGEVINEAKKDYIKENIKMLMEMQKNPKLKEEYKKEVFEIIDAELEDIADEDNTPSK